MTTETSGDRSGTSAARVGFDAEPCPDPLGEEVAVDPELHAGELRELVDDRVRDPRSVTFVPEPSDLADRVAAQGRAERAAGRRAAAEIGVPRGEARVEEAMERRRDRIRVRV